ncbi:hypothetical protein P3T76_003382 [Phytophthora citrophthora]|uniref:Uncharacterized protein n=1 Tax=Phytophthora citrophthora TaxID=4793 RepID=A0AAD9GTI8_9STRA|nr:hypothetical protein P3T76_003382 [Phytophthora citrophthora]
MALSPAGAAMLTARMSTDILDAKPTRTLDTPPDRSRAVDQPHASINGLQAYFQSAMDKFLKQRQMATVPRATARAADPEYRDVDMQSVGSHPKN